MACLRLVTLPPFPPLPLLSVPFFLRRIALSTRLLAAFPYFRAPVFFLPPRFLAAISGSVVLVGPPTTMSGATASRRVPEQIGSKHHVGRVRRRGAGRSCASICGALRRA